MSLGTGDTLCAIEFLENPPSEQRSPCTYVNGCASGFGCLLSADPPPGVVCARYCDPNVTTGGGSCNDLGSFSCVTPAEFYGLEYVTDYGFCAPDSQIPALTPPALARSLRDPR